MTSTSPKPLRRVLVAADGRVKMQVPGGYQPLPTDDPDAGATAKIIQRVRPNKDSWGMQFLEEPAFQCAVASLIIANALIIGSETGSADRKHWELAENALLLFFVLELFMRMLFLGPRTMLSIYHHDFGWNAFDLLIVGFGVGEFVEAKMHGTSSGNFITVFRTIRLVRILRVFPVVKSLKQLYLLTFCLAEAAKAVMWVATLMVVVLFVCSIVLVKTVGSPMKGNPHFDFFNYHFGSIPESMLTLFSLMSSPSTGPFQDEIGLVEQNPFFCLFIVAFITFGSFGILAMMCGLITESVLEKNEMRKQEARLEHEETRLSLGDKSRQLFQTLPLDANGEATVGDVIALAPKLAAMLEAAGANVAQYDMLELIEDMDTNGRGTINATDFSQTMQKIAEGLCPLSIQEVHHEVGAVHKSVSDVQQSVNQITKVMQKLLERSESSHKGVEDVQLCVSYIEAQLQTAPKPDRSKPVELGVSQAREFQNLQQSVNDMRLKVEHMVDQNESCARVEASVNDMKLTVNKLADQPSKSNDELRESVNYMKASLNKLMDRSESNHATQIQSPTQKMVGQSDSNCELRESVNDMKATVKKLGEQFESNHTTQIESLTEKLVDRSESTCELRESVKDMKAVLNKLIEQSASNYEAQIASLTTRMLDQSENTCDELRESVNDMKAALGKMIEHLEYNHATPGQEPTKTPADRSESGCELREAVTDMQATLKKLIEQSESNQTTQMQSPTEKLVRRSESNHDLRELVNDLKVTMQKLLEQSELNHESQLQSLKSVPMAPSEPSALSADLVESMLARIAQMLSKTTVVASPTPANLQDATNGENLAEPMLALHESMEFMLARITEMLSTSTLAVATPAKIQEENLAETLLASITEVLSKQTSAIQDEVAQRCKQLGASQVEVTQQCKELALITEMLSTSTLATPANAQCEDLLVSITEVLSRQTLAIQEIRSSAPAHVQCEDLGQSLLGGITEVLSKQTLAIQDEVAQRCKESRALQEEVAQQCKALAASHDEVAQQYKDSQLVMHMLAASHDEVAQQCKELTSAHERTVQSLEILAIPPAEQCKALASSHDRTVQSLAVQPQSTEAGPAKVTAKHEVIRTPPPKEDVAESTLQGSNAAQEEPIPSFNGSELRDFSRESTGVLSVDAPGPGRTRHAERHLDRLLEKMTKVSRQTRERSRPEKPVAEIPSESKEDADLHFDPLVLYPKVSSDATEEEVAVKKDCQDAPPEKVAAKEDSELHTEDGAESAADGQTETEPDVEVAVGYDSDLKRVEMLQYAVSLESEYTADTSLTAEPAAEIDSLEDEYS